MRGGIGPLVSVLSRVIVGAAAGPLAALAGLAAPDSINVRFFICAAVVGAVAGAVADIRGGRTIFKVMVTTAVIFGCATLSWGLFDMVLPPWVSSGESPGPTLAVFALSVFIAGTARALRNGSRRKATFFAARGAAAALAALIVSQYVGFTLLHFAFGSLNPYDPATLNRQSAITYMQWQPMIFCTTEGLSATLGILLSVPKHTASSRYR